MFAGGIMYDTMFRYDMLQWIMALYITNELGVPTGKEMLQLQRHQHRAFLFVVLPRYFFQDITDFIKRIFGESIC